MGAREQGREGAREGEGGERVLEREGRSRPPSAGLFKLQIVLFARRQK